MPRKPLIDKHGEIREITAEDMKHFRPAIEVIPEIVAAYRKSRGRPVGRSKETVTLSLDADLASVLRASGKGWQTRVNAALRKSFKVPAKRIKEKMA